MKNLYLDNSATTKMLPEVIEEMIYIMKNVYGNPNSKYYDQAETAKSYVEKSRNMVSNLLNCSSDEIIFTSGSTESNNTILKGIMDANLKRGNHLIISSIEHSSVLNTAKFLESKGYKVTYLPVNSCGQVDISEVLGAITRKTVLISIMWANNETGAINQIKDLSKIARDHNVLFHSDATQAVGKIKIDMNEYSCVDFLSISAHKFYGPKGIGAIYMRKNELLSFPKITPLLHGGNQERYIRSGTLPVHQIVGMGKAAEIACINLDKNIDNLIELENKLKKRLLLAFGEKIHFNNNTQDKIPGLLSIRIDGINNQVFLKDISTFISASSGSACSNNEPSHVLRAMGFSDKEIRETIRFSISPYEEYDDFMEIE